MQQAPEFVKELQRLAGRELVRPHCCELRLHLGRFVRLGRLGSRRARRRGGEQRQVVDQARQGAGLLAALQAVQHLLGAGDDRARQAGELSHMDAVGAVRRSGRHLVQEDHLSLPFLDPHAVARQGRQLLGEVGQLVIMGREERPAAVHLVQVLDAGPGDRQAVEGGGAPADLVEDHQGALARLVEDDGRLDHLDHEGRASAREIIGGADPAEQAVDNADVGRVRRHEGAHLGEHGNQRILPQEGALARHVGTGDQPDPAVFREPAVVGDEPAFAAGGKRPLDHRMAAARHLEGGRTVDPRALPALRGGELGQGGGHVERGERGGGAGGLLGAARHLAHQVVEQLQLDRQRLVGGGGNLLLQIRQLDGGVTHGAGQGLAMDEGGLGPARQLVGLGRRDLDVVAEHVVVADLEGGDAGFRDVAALQVGDQAAALVAQAAQRVQLRRIAGRDEAAVAGMER